MAFNAALDAGGTGIFTGAGGATAPIALASGPTFNDFSAVSPSINAAGRVAFWATTDFLDSGVFTSTGGTATSIALESGPLSQIGNPSINASGTVVFVADIDGTRAIKAFSPARGEQRR